MSRLRRADWLWRFAEPPERIWPALADTARFNEAAELPKHRIEEVLQQDGSVIYIGRARFGPFEISWRDIPVEWSAGRHFRHTRRFRNGPFVLMTASLALTREGAGTRADYTLEVEPANLLGRLILACGFFRNTERTFTRLIGGIADYAAGRAEQPYAAKGAALSDEASKRLQAQLRQVEAEGVRPALTRRLGTLIVEGSELDLQHIRPLRLARQWGEPEREVIELGLRAVRAGLLTLQWELLCPNCRGAKAGAATLERLPRGAHCATCNIDYERDFSRNVELTFRPSPAIRPLSEGEFCLFSPMTTPHVAVQQTLAPGETRDVPAELAFGAYRLRTLHPGGAAPVEWNSGGFPAVVADSKGVHAGPPAPPGMVRLENRGEREVTLVVESRAWVAEALTAHRATTMQSFRDLFATEILRPGDEAGIGQVTLMFTDLRGSTALYGRIGDAAAYRLVREHFAFLAETVREHDGAVIKTIGDAVMAAFSDPSRALAAALAVQGRVAAFNRDHPDGGGAEGDGVVIKLGLHTGACIAVSLNGRLDYFGGTVNLAARLQGQSRGGDIVVSEDLANDPAVAGQLAKLGAQPETALVKGIETPVAFRRIVGVAG
ncbi:MAG: adenylate/guanylate cyclase domain-containing protein [Alphaproteobacteria bacterium]|nr:adenylate/guanylate cyclase domain-containing protein [Alphaproteobacteria bacterium]